MDLVTPQNYKTKRLLSELTTKYSHDILEHDTKDTIYRFLFGLNQDNIDVLMMLTVVIRYPPVQYSSRQTGLLGLRGLGGEHARGGSTTSVGSRS